MPLRDAIPMDVPPAPPPEVVQRMVNLWAAVLLQAVQDARAEVKQGIDGPAKAWITSKRTGPGSMLWVCDILGLDPEVIDVQL